MFAARRWQMARKTHRTILRKKIAVEFTCMIFTLFKRFSKKYTTNFLALSVYGRKVWIWAILNER